MTDLGTDISTPIGEGGSQDLDPFFSMVDGRELLAQDLLARITTPTGGLLDDGSYGYDVRAHLNDSAPDGAQIAAAVRAQWLSDERVVDARVTVTFADDALTIRGVVVDGDGPFRLVVAIDALTVTMLEAA